METTPDKVVEGYKKAQEAEKNEEEEKAAKEAGKKAPQGAARQKLPPVNCESFSGLWFCDQDLQP